MKKLLVLVIALSLMLGGAVAFAYDEGGEINIKESSFGSASDPVRVYQLVRYPNFGPTIGTSLSAGDVVIWDLISDDGVTVNIIGPGAISASNDAVAGVVVGAIPTADNQASSAAADIGRRNWGYIQTYGLGSAYLDKGAHTAGLGIRASTSARQAGPISVATATTAVGAGYGSLGFAMDTCAAGTEAKTDVFIRCR